MTKEFSQGKIYVIRAPSGRQYIGSTTKRYLSDRMSHHRWGFREWKKGRQDYTTSYSLFEESYDNVTIELLENYPCSDINELRAREGYWIRNIEGGCINKVIIGRTRQEWFQENRETLKEKKKKNYNEHIEERKQRNQEYYNNNRKTLLHNSREYYQTNKDYLSEKIECGCGAKICRKSLSRHRKTKKHTDFENSNQK